MATVLAGLGADCGRRDPGIAVGSKDFTEQLILGHLAAKLVAARLPDVPVTKRLNLGGTIVCFSALRRGDIDVYPEYTGTVLAAILKEAPPPGGALAAFRRVRAELARRYGVVCLQPLGFNNTYALMMRSAAARALRVDRISDLAGHRDDLLAGFTPEFLQRDDGYAGLTGAYGFSFTRPPLQMSSGLMYRALQGGQVDVISGFSTDGRVRAFKLKILEDDRWFFPPYEACLLVRKASLERHPRLDGALRELSGLLNNAAMRSLNASVDLGGKAPSVAAEQYLKHRRLLR